mgnify:CR=1 FL=1
MSAHPDQVETVSSRRAVAARGFSLVDLLVSLTIIAVLIGILLPSLARINETTRRVICRSNLRQVAIGVSMYASDNSGFLPRSQYVSTTGLGGRSSLTTTLRVDESGGTRAPRRTDFDGLGMLYMREYLLAPKIFYCPSHSGANPFARFTNQWAGSPGVIFGNYQFRGTMANGSRLLNVEDEFSGAALVSDGLASVNDFSHRTGLNLMRADLSVTWLSDDDRSIRARIATPGSRDQAVGQTWPLLDRALGVVRDR